MRKYNNRMGLVMFTIFLFIELPILAISKCICVMCTLLKKTFWDALMYHQWQEHEKTLGHLPSCITEM